MFPASFLEHTWLIGSGGGGGSWGQDLVKLNYLVCNRFVWQMDLIVRVLVGVSFIMLSLYIIQSSHISTSFHWAAISRFCAQKLWRRSHDKICSGKKSPILQTHSRNASFQIPFHSLLSSGLWSGFMNPPLHFFQTAKGKAPKEAWGGRLSGESMIDVCFYYLKQ